VLLDGVGWHRVVNFNRAEQPSLVAPKSYNHRLLCHVHDSLENSRLLENDEKDHVSVLSG
jgi:hypothetical protein